MPGACSPEGAAPAAPSDLGVPIGPMALRASHADRDETVDVLRIAAGDGRLSAAELDERLEAALSARTVGELARLTVDLPAVSAPRRLDLAAKAKDVVRIEQRGSSVQRTGRWVAPRRLELHTSYSEVILDLTQAVFTQDTLHIDMDISGGAVTIVTVPGTVIDADALVVTYGAVKLKQTAAPGAAVALRVELTGRIHCSRVLARPARRTFWQWLLRRPVALPSAAD